MKQTKNGFSPKFPESRQYLDRSPEELIVDFLPPELRQDKSVSLCGTAAAVNSATSK